MNILSIQSHVAFGHVGNAAATFPLQRLGIEVWPIHTVQFSNHTGYGDWKGRVFDAGMIGEVVAGIGARGVLGTCDGVLSGYMGAADIGAAILDAVAKVRRENPAARYCCDPVIGDVGRGIFVRGGIPEFMRRKAVPAADIVTPNHFELDYLSGRKSKTIGSARDAVSAVHDLGPRAILVTSLHTDETPENCIDMLASDDGGCFLVRTPKLPLTINGAGDAVAALFFAHYMLGEKIGDALSRTASSIFGVLAKTAEAGAREIQLVAAQDEIVRPGRVFEARPIERPARRPARTLAPAEAPPLSHGVELPGPSGVPSVFHIDRLELSLVPKPWAFANAHRAEIDAWFAVMRRQKPALWNGRVLMLHRHVIEHGVMRGEFLETDYASFAAWKHRGRPHADVHDCFSAAAVETSDGAFLLGVMGAHTLNAGRIYFPCGTPDPTDIIGDKVDFEYSVRRELLEETGLAVDMFTPEPGWTMVVDGSLIAQIKVLRARESAKVLHARILAFLAREKAPELSDIRIVYGAGDFDPAMSRFVTAFLAARFAGRRAARPSEAQHGAQQPR
jgi:pyridoxine kinase